jgi:hypothetical protein
MIELVTTLGAMLMGKDLACHGVKGHSLNIPMASRKDFRRNVSLAIKRVVLRNAAVVMEPNDSASMIAGCLRPIFVTSVSEGQINKAFAIQKDPATKMPPSAGFWLHAEEPLDIDQTIIFQARPDECSAKH